ncbi:penicillin-binding protein 2 [Tumidithrix elongata RA019]|uniref:Penicillin-binding protein 2 n=1 Tax=Tumidithrix elongata BACA0141 TaxID=2716417 RepID=A0AAW9Q0B7_9CYAN|nr:penicillin-binding protein 2 [Tumidithrix elongata RA019]
MVNPPARSNSNTQDLKFRTLLVWGILALASLGLIARLVFLQVLTFSDLKAKADGQLILQFRPFIARRDIIDRHGLVLAIDKPEYSLYAHPPQIKKQITEMIRSRLRQLKVPPEEISKRIEEEVPKKLNEVAEKLSAILIDRPAPKVLELLKQNDTTVKIQEWIPPEQADRIADLKVSNKLSDLSLDTLKADTIPVDGLETTQHRRRSYPQQDLAAEVIGYVDIDHRGQAGIEFSQQKLLEPTIRDTETGNRDKLIPNSVPAGMIHADQTKLQLTIDARIQRTARQVLKQQITKYGAKRGAVLVMDVRDGGLLALVTEPTYDPNQFFQAKVELFKNWAVSDLYEPGSTFKPINVAIALEAGAIQPDTVFYDEGALTIGGWPVANFDYESAGANGSLSISQILERSSNVGMVHIIQRMKPSVYYGWLERIGLGDITGIDLPAETPSSLKPQNLFVEQVIEPATAAFGQGFSLTPIQLLQLHGMIASRGKLLTPHVVKGLINAEGEDYSQNKLPAPRQIFSPSTMVKVLEMMTNVVEKGTGKPARIPGYRLGGKTGTAQKAAPTGGYSRAKITSFVGIFPSNEPRYVVVAVIDEPVGDDAFGSTVAAPIVKAVIEDIIVTENIPPTHLSEIPTKLPPVQAQPEPQQQTKPSQTNQKPINSNP